MQIGMVLKIYFSLLTTFAFTSVINYNTTFVFKTFIFCSTITFTVGTFTFRVWTVAHFITFFTKSFSHFFLLGNPSANHLTNLVHGQVMVSIIFLIILSLLNVIEEFITIFCFPLTTIFYIPFTSLNFPVERYFIPYRERWYAPD